MKNLLIGIQTFYEIRDKEKKYIYIDKIDLAHQLIDKGNTIFFHAHTILVSLFF